jgi:hypothetical protein
MADIQVANSDADLSDNTLVTEENAYTITGLHTFSRSTNAPFAVVSGAAVVANLDADKLDGIQATGFVKADGTVALSANWDSGGYEIRANTFESDVATGTIPLVIASTTKCTNLNADKLDDQEGTYYLAAGNATGTLAVGKGGTGATTLTDGGVLIGNGTGAIVALAVLADGEVLVGDGTTDPTPESGATLRTSVGVGTGDSPQFTGIELGHATDTTLTKASSGDVNIEGNIIYRAGGTDVPVTDGGTGVGTLTDGGVLLGSGTGDITAMAVLANSEMIVGDGSGDPVAETGSTLRTSIGCDVATNITSGTMATARLGSGTASSGTFLRGDSSWTAVSATNAAGSDTQVQYNDGGTAFGGDAGLVYNDSTDVLTSGKLATTDTSATSIDVAGGITAGTSNIAIVNAVGKIPELSSTYLADLSGANLTGISAGATTFIGAANGSTTTTADTMYGSVAVSGLAITDTLMCTWSFTNSGGNINDPRIVQGSVSTQYSVVSENNINGNNSGVSYARPCGATNTIVEASGVMAYTSGGSAIGAGLTIADFTGSYNLGLAFALAGGTTVWQVQFYKIKGS